MSEKERFNHELQVHSCRSPTVEEIIDEVRSTWWEPEETISRGIRRVISLGTQGVLSDDEVYTLLRYIVTGFISSKVDNLLAETELYPFGVEWHPTTESRRRLSGISLARIL